MLVSYANQNTSCLQQIKQTSHPTQFIPDAHSDTVRCHSNTSPCLHFYYITLYGC